MYPSILTPDEDSDRVLADLAPMILELPVSSLRSLHIDARIPGKTVPTVLESAVSSTIIRCGPSLTSLRIEVSLSDAAVQHITKLPKLTLWKAVDGPPRVSDLHLSNTFPQLETLELITEELALEWIPFFGAISRHASSSQPSDRRPVQKLIVLESCAEIPVDAAFMSPTMQFRGLAKLWPNSSCPNANGCTFQLDG